MRTSRAAQESSFAPGIMEAAGKAIKLEKLPSASSSALTHTRGRSGICSCYRIPEWSWKGPQCHSLLQSHPRALKWSHFQKNSLFFIPNFYSSHGEGNVPRVQPQQFRIQTKLPKIRQNVSELSRKGEQLKVIWYQIHNQGSSSPVLPSPEIRHRHSLTPGFILSLFRQSAPVWSPDPPVLTGDSTELCVLPFCLLEEG